MKRFLTAAAVMLALFSTTSVRANIVADPGFETPVITTNSFTYGPANPGPWTYAGYSGIVNGTAAGFTPPGFVESGAQSGFVQEFNGVSSSITQTTTMAAGMYTLSLLDATRSAAVPSSFTVSVDGTVVATVVATTTTLAAYTGSFTVIGSGAHTLTITSVYTGSSDSTSFIDDVTINAVPEPASIAMLGFGLVASAGFAVRKARRNRN